MFALIGRHFCIATLCSNFHPSAVGLIKIQEENEGIKAQEENNNNKTQKITHKC